MPQSLLFPIVVSIDKSVGAYSVKTSSGGKDVVVRHAGKSPDSRLKRWRGELLLEVSSVGSPVLLLLSF